jgi:hypothetical protein
VLSVDGRNVMKLGYAERREILEGLGLNDPFWRTPAAVDDGAALWEAVCEHELEGVVAKRRSGDTCPAAAAGSRRRTAPRLLAAPRHLDGSPGPGPDAVVLKARSYGYTLVLCATSGHVATE